MAKNLTAQQEGFAFDLAYNNKTKSQAYRDNYKVKPTTKPATIWRSAHEVAKNAKVAARVRELRAEKHREKVLEFSWNAKEAEKTLLKVINLNIKELEETNQENGELRAANNAAIITAVAELNKLLERLEPVEEENTGEDLAITIVDEWKGGE